MLAPLAGDDDKCVGDTEGEACAIACAADPPADWGVNVSRCRDLCCGASQRFFPATCEAGAATPGGKGCFMQCCRETSSSAVAVAGKPISACFSSADAAESSAACAAQCCGGGVCGGNLRASGSAAVAARAERRGARDACHKFLLEAVSNACPAFFANDYAVIAHQRLLVALCEDGGAERLAGGEEARAAVRAAVQRAC